MRRCLTFTNVLLLFAILASPAATALAQQDEAPNGPPEWFLSHMIDLLGIRHTDNSAYKSEREPVDAYGDEYWWGPGQLSLSGRLFAIRDGEELGDSWVFRVYWHPGEGAAYIDQWGRNGAMGTGRMRPLDDGLIESIQTYYENDGSTSRSRHLVSPVVNGRTTTQSFTWADDGWQPGRTYVWVRQ